MNNLKSKGFHRHARDPLWDESHRGGDHHRRGGGHRHGGGGRRRLFDQGDLRLIILKLAAETPRHGYEIIKLVEDKSGGAYTPSPGIVYPTLTLLEELGYVAQSASDGAKKLYAITQDGKAFLDQNRATVDDLMARMDKIGAAQGETSPQILRAIDNLRSALRLRLAQGGIGGDQSQAIADALDKAAKKIEQS